MQRMQILLGEINLKKQEPMHFAKLILLVLALADLRFQSFGLN